VGDEVRVAHGGDAVSDALDPQVLQRVPARPGPVVSPAWGRPQPGRPGRIEVGRLVARHAVLGTAEPEADQAVRALLQRDRPRLVCGRRATSGSVIRSTTDRYTSMKCAKSVNWK
jgi:hypothetical protein